MADDFRAYRGVVPSGGVMSALPKAEPTDQEQAYLDAYLADQRRRYVKDDFRAPAPGPSTMDSLKGGAKGLFESMSLFNLVPEAARAAYSGFTLPSDAYRGKAPPVNLPDGSINPAAIERAADFTGLVTLGAGAVPAEANALRAGMSFPPDGKRIFSGKLADEAVDTAETWEDTQKLFNRDPTKALREPLRTVGDDGFYSQAEKAMMEFPQAKAKWADIKKFLLKSKNSVKQEELDIVGLNYKGSDIVDRDEVIAKIRAGQANLPKISVTQGDGSEYQQYTMLGGENFQQDLIKIQNRTPPAPYLTFEQWRGETAKDYERIWRRDNPDKELTESISSFLNEVRSGGRPSTEAMLETKYRSAKNEYQQKIDEEFKSYKATHFTSDDQNRDLALHILRKDETIPASESGPEIKRRRIEEFQSDKATDYRKFLEKRAKLEKQLKTANSYDDRGRQIVQDKLDNLKFDADPYTMDDKWVTLGVKTSLAKAAEDGVDEILIAPPEVITKRWRGSDQKTLKKLDVFYRKELPNEFENWVRRMGGKKGELIETNVEKVDFSTPIETLLLDENFDLQSFLDKARDLKITDADIDVGDPNEFMKNVMYDSTLLANVEPAKRSEWIKENTNQRREKFNKLKNRLDKLAFSDEAKTMSPEELSYAEDELYQEIVAAETDFNAAVILPELLKQAGVDYKTAGAPRINAYVIKLTPDVRKRILEKLMPRMAKGGIVDIASSWLYTDK